MNGMDKITERILDDARQEAERILEDAQRRAEAIKKESESKAAAVRERLIREYETKASELKGRMISVAQLDMRKKVLEVKQEMIDKAFERCLANIMEMPPKEYRKLMEELLIASVQRGDEEVVFSRLDDSRLGNDFLSGVNGRLTAMGRKGALKAAKEKGSFQGGFILRTGGVEINNTFESMLRIVREEIEPKVAEMLFS